MTIRSSSCSLVMCVWLVGACNTEELLERQHECTYTEVQVVGGDDPTDLGFTPNEVLAAASVSTSADTLSTEDVPDPLSVELSHVFTSAGDAKLVDYGAANDPACPSGRALWVPARYEANGSIGGWEVSASREGFSLVATSADIASISSDYAAPPEETWQAEVDEALADLAQDGMGPTAPAGCTMTFSLGPMPESLAAGAWATEVTEGWLARNCGSQWSEFLNWTATISNP